jgi:hypothetical protein
MGTVIGHLVPLAIGYAFTPLPIVTVILILLTATNATPAGWFMVGWAVGIVAALGSLLAVAHTIGLMRTGRSTLVAIIEIVVGVGALLLAGLVWRTRPAPDQPTRPPRWVALLGTLTPVRSAGLGFALAAFGPKNIALNIAAAVIVTGATLAAGGTAVALSLYVALAASTVIAPVVAFAVVGERARSPLDRLRGWLARHGFAVTAILLVGFAAVLFGNALYGRL